MRWYGHAADELRWKLFLNCIDSIYKSAMSSALAPPLTAFTMSFTHRCTHIPRPQQYIYKSKATMRARKCSGRPIRSLAASTQSGAMHALQASELVAEVLQRIQDSGRPISSSRTVLHTLYGPRLECRPPCIADRGAAMSEEQQAGVDATLERLESIGAAQVACCALLLSPSSFSAHAPTCLACMCRSHDHCRTLRYMAIMM